MESRRLGEIASEAEELLLFTQGFPWLGQHFLSEEIGRWGKKQHIPHSYHSHHHQMFLQLKEREDGTELPVWEMLMHECSLSLSFILLLSFSLIISRRLELLQLFDTAVPFP